MGGSLVPLIADPSQFVREIDQSRGRNVYPSTEIPPPEGCGFDIYKYQLVLERGQGEFPDFMISFGFVASVAYSCSNDTESHLRSKAIPELPFKYGLIFEETKRIWAFARVNAFASTCIAGRVSNPIAILFWWYLTGFRIQFP